MSVLSTEWAAIKAANPGFTTDQLLVALNAATVSSPARAVLSPSAIINAIVPADLAALSTAQVTFLALILSGSSVDASAGTTIRVAVQTIFAGKTTTLTNLSALVAPFDNATIPWWQANGFPGPITRAYLTAESPPLT